MAYDEDLADRIRELIAAEQGVEEKRMFGGLAFLINGNMSVAASGRGGLMVRVPPDETEKLLARDHVEPMVMAGRETRGWLRVSRRRCEDQTPAAGLGHAEASTTRRVCRRNSTGTPAEVDTAARKRVVRSLLKQAGTTYARRPASGSRTSRCRCFSC